MFGKRRNDRRRPENAELRKHFERERKTQASENLAAAQRLTAQTAQRIERLRDISHLIDLGKKEHG